MLRTESPSQLFPSLTLHENNYLVLIEENPLEKKVGSSSMCKQKTELFVFQRTEKKLKKRRKFRPKNLQLCCWLQKREKVPSPAFLRRDKPKNKSYKTVSVWSSFVLPKWCIIEYTISICNRRIVTHLKCLLFNILAFTMFICIYLVIIFKLRITETYFLFILILFVKSVTKTGSQDDFARNHCLFHFENFSFNVNFVLQSLN